MSKSVFSGYYNDYESTESTFENGWFLTGDAGYFDDDGHLVIIGRKQDIIRDKEGNAFSPGFHRDQAQVLALMSRRPSSSAKAGPTSPRSSTSTRATWATGRKTRMIPYTTYTDLSQRPEVEGLILAEVKKGQRAAPDCP